MVASSDKEYKLAKRIKQKKSGIDSNFLELANWISEKYEVNVINITHEIMNHDNRIRIGIAVETENDEIKFKESDEQWANYNEKIQNAIAEKYLEICKTLEIPNEKSILGLTKKLKPKLKDIFVSASAFEPLAKEEANGLIPEPKIKELLANLNNNKVWTLSRCFASTTLFVFDDRQKEKISKSDFFKELEKRYFELLKEYDEFDYWKRDEFKIGIDSKQNFDENYESSWFYYYR
ncbi:hypothetical protein ACFQ1R_11645 [Mariniflexile jejuense]|uniref:Uncharacterized protein n=1 Tax=Mariniflexile jejuense TaxID=1173582 RepID=A0ABW3JMG7_9FLAO